MIGEQECDLLQQLACIGWGLEETSKGMMADAAEAAVRTLAQLTLNDSIQCTHYLRQLASSKGCILQLRRMPAKADCLNETPPYAGTAFDRQYLQETAQWHALTIQMAQALAARTTDVKIRKFAGQLARQSSRRLSLVSRLQAQLERHLAHQRHYV